ncbi:MAG: PDDEXK nuclease domain-containing protein [Candidatus Omnitrophota bacterium]
MNVVLNNKEYKQWLLELKNKIQKAQIKAAIKVNTELLLLYWEMGADIVKKQKNAKWGEGFIEQLSSDLMREFPDMKGFSRSNLMYIRQWYLFYSSDKAIVQQLVGQLVEIPWGHNIAIITKCENVKEALYYVQNTIKHNWSRNVLVHQIESGLINRERKSINNFAMTLPKPQSDLARQTLKDPYVFDFLNMTGDCREKEMEDALVEHITKFLLELGAGFSYMGRQIRLEVGESEFFIDLLFYHVRLHCYVVVELKTGKFEPEHAGKLNFYVTAVDRQLKSASDQPTIGILICKTKDKIVAEYALSDIKKPIGVSQYQLTKSLPKKFKSSLPSIKEIEAGLNGE